jgi:fumarate reductase subunit C
MQIFCIKNVINLSNVYFIYCLTMSVENSCIRTVSYSNFTYYSFNIYMMCFVDLLIKLLNILTFVPYFPLIYNIYIYNEQTNTHSIDSLLYCPSFIAPLNIQIKNSIINCEPNMYVSVHYTYV